MKVEDKLLRRTDVTRERKEQECAEICNMNITIARNIKHFYIGMNNGGWSVWVWNVAGMLETREFCMGGKCSRYVRDTGGLYGWGM
jgi:hypothetical protein